ncbi:DUF29 domain-containing protein [Endozoicomonas sp. GU-1]|uniref:DUF29 domain-containing protein n=1 Tax=Endozoicomonas sp. GU-1 TaxID=3009078 RepID=UPI0022B37626|nr:DUF29 domain-containing protein [Endozoicomonas sp. GU-1]WBA79634.1 DUF29 domain-containing protein [Endozoicomonas sp. GU-1]WBA87216.1 DUF29 domain-containing protein [Endozoicomonas sp. GU-1]
MKDLYQTDFYSWTQQQAELIRSGRIAELDLHNILEEIEGMGRSDYRALQSRLTVLLMHLLKWQYQPDKRLTGHSWESTIKEQRKQIRRLLRANAGLKSKIPEMLPLAYEDAVEDAHDETGIPTSSFPNLCPWRFEEVIDADFKP